MRSALFAIATLALAQRIPPGFSAVKPTPAKIQNSSAPDLTIARSQFFSYALPHDWKIGESGQYALTLVAPDQKAITIMVGNAGVPINFPPARYIQERLSAMRPDNLQISQPRQAAPVSGFKQAWQFDVSYSVRGSAWRGQVKCNVSPAYDSAVMAMTGAISEASQWQAYSAWLPLVADQVSAINGAAFGSRGIMAQNLQNSREYGEAAQRYREWSQKNWQQVTNDRNAQQDRQNFHLREALGGIKTYVNPYDSRVPLELPDQYKHFWVDRQGNVIGTNDPGANPNTGSTGDWRKMPRYEP
jgi:hypothetical protein